MSDEQTHDWLDEREPDYDRPSLWDEREITESTPEPPEEIHWEHEMREDEEPDEEYLDWLHRPESNEPC